MRHSALALLACVAVGGCMKIYQDPELPDLSVYWYAGECPASTPDITFTLTSLEDGSTIERTASCEAEQLQVPDVKRHRYRVDGALLGTDGTVFTTATGEADLRNSIDTEVYLYFDIDSRVMLNWVFDMGATCDSLSADYVAIDFYADDYYIESGAQTCEALYFVGSPGPWGSTQLTLEVRAMDGNTTVAISPRSIPFTLAASTIDLGTFVLTPCGASCPPPPEQ